MGLLLLRVAAAVVVAPNGLERGRCRQVISAADAPLSSPKAEWCCACDSECRLEPVLMSCTMMGAVTLRRSSRAQGS